MIKLIGTDFDGTLLDDNKKVSTKNRKYLKKAKNNNIKVVGVTGRTLESVKNATDIELFDYLILNNGANIYDVDEKKSIFNNSISLDISEEITKRFEERVYQFDYCTMSNYHLYKNYKDKKLPFIKEIKDVKEVVDPISKINIFIENKNDLKDIYKELVEMNYDVKVSIMQDSGKDKQWIVITPNNLSKKEALEFLGEYLNISMEEIVFFGDGLNDVEVIAAVGVGVAMENALEEVKSKAKTITKSNNDSGIAYYIKEYILKEKAE